MKPEIVIYQTVLPVCVVKALSYLGKEQKVRAGAGAQRKEM